MKLDAKGRSRLRGICRSRKGAWIEILFKAADQSTFMVAPVRERGLKFFPTDLPCDNEGRSRKGAWIEICNSFLTLTYDDASLP